MTSRLLLVTLLTLAGCPAAEEECAFTAGQVTTSTGSSVGDDGYNLGLGSGSINFSNLNTTFYPGGPNKVIVDAGSACLDDVTTWPGGGTGGRITMFTGHLYVVQFTAMVGGQSELTYAKFVVDDYADGVVTVTFLPSL